ncbi:MAG: ribosomal RNA small subunit methyltransferase A [candidate division Zixibacteria bacterium RBG_16_50_21]|nr:MAG: ribosomal RNA small subunit methyltransferase A [candidate division Zixibacteria bacterium RBG_16_50_21]
MPSKPTGSKIRPRKSFSQNFLVNLNAARRIVDSLELSPDETVLEIGAGQGVLTRYLVEKAKRVLAVELDRNLVALLKERFAQSENLEIISADVLKVRLADYVLPSQKIKIVGNLPYQITSPILEWMMNQRELIQQAVVTVQREVAKRLSAKPGTRDWSPISIFCQVYSQPQILFILSPGSFFPAPKVDSAVVRLEILPRPLVTFEVEPAFFQLVRKIFTARRKTLLKALSSGIGYSRSHIESALKECLINPKTRGETLTISQLQTLTSAVSHTL